MQFANQAISLFISGFFCLTWIGLLVLPLDNYSIFKSLGNQKIITDLVSLGLLIFTFVVFPLSYALGSAVNAIVNRLFSRMDKIIRREIFKKNMKNWDWEEISEFIGKRRKTKISFGKEDFDGVINETKAAPGDNFSKIIREIYHHNRFKIYKSSPEMHKELLFHREIIRVLRATCFNFFMIFLVLLTVSNRDLLKYIGYIIIGVFLMYIWLLPKIGDWLDFSRIFLNNKSRFIFTLLFFTGTILLFWLVPPTCYLFISAFPFTIFIAFTCIIAWKKQQEDFYKTIIDASKVME